MPMPKLRVLLGSPPPIPSSPAQPLVPVSDLDYQVREAMRKRALVCAWRRGGKTHMMLHTIVPAGVECPLCLEMELAHA